MLYLNNILLYRSERRAKDQTVGMRHKKAPEIPQIQAPSTNETGQTPSLSALCSYVSQKEKQVSASNFLPKELSEAKEK